VKFGVVIFPGSNCDYDCIMLARELNQSVVELWHESYDLQGVDCVILPGGFSYGDYLRTGAIGAHAVIMDAVKKHAKSGGLVLGICNGFQTLCESGLLPGALIRNAGMRFRCIPTFLRVERTDTPFSNAASVGQTLRVPINHGEGNYVALPDDLKKLESRKQVLFRYCNSNGEVNASSNPNGSMNNIAGLCNEEGNVLGMMPHPERAADTLLGSTDGLVVFRSLLASVPQLAASA
jgi:phosphoribosylformylglycinamidine synthase